CLEPDGRTIPYDIRMGVWVTVEGETSYIRNCFEEYNAHTDPSGRYFTLYKRWHLIGLEVGMSVASVALRGEATGTPSRWVADVAATAKRALAAGETLDGEGGYTVWGKLLPVERSLTLGAVPLGLAHGIRLKRAVAADAVLTWTTWKSTPPPAPTSCASSSRRCRRKVLTPSSCACRNVGAACFPCRDPAAGQGRVRGSCGFDPGSAVHAPESPSSRYDRSSASQ